ncbi:hypothetical protein [Bacillus testis]|uniref:hypothetical protein n=1 Tax=Bacillus testis TaxID=1622072 RepID=UPI00067F6FDA|nr:hypothetical protein [Bacillus testis]
MLPQSIRHAFIGYEYILDRLEYPLYITQLIPEEEAGILQSFLDKYEFDVEKVLFDEFRFHYLCYRKMVLHNQGYPSL